MKNFFNLIASNASFIKNIFILIILARLLFIETDNLILIAEIVGALCVMMTDLCPNPYLDH
jgi:hypothetical protein